MSESLRYCLILLAALISVFSSVSGKEPISKYVCEGEYVQLFNNITLTRDNTVNLYINGRNNELISTWHSGRNHFTHERYKETLFLDDCRNIWIRNIKHSQAGTYVLQYDTDIMKSEVQIHVMVAPTKFCKPKIEKIESLLIASLEEKDCGKPLAQVHWMEHPENSYIHNNTLKLPSENEAGTYFACATSLALKCAETLNQSNHCTGFKVKREGTIQEKEVESRKDKDNSPPVSLEIWDVKIVNFVLLPFISVIAVAVCIIILIRWRKKRANVELVEKSILDPKASSLKDETELLLKGTADTVVTLYERTSPQVATIQAVRPGLPAHCTSCIDPQRETESNSTENQPSTYSAITKVLQKSTKPPRCIICRNSSDKNKIYMFILNCKNGDPSYVPLCVACHNESEQKKIALLPLMLADI